MENLLYRIQPAIIETDFTLTHSCQTGIILLRHYFKLVGVYYDNT